MRIERIGWMVALIPVLARAAPPSDIAQKRAALEAQLEARTRTLDGILDGLAPLLDAHGPDGVPADKGAQFVKALSELVQTVDAALALYEGNKVALAAAEPNLEAQLGALRQLAEVKTALQRLRQGGSDEKRAAVQLAAQMLEQRRRAMEAMAKSNLLSLRTALEQFNFDNGRYTDDIKTLGVRWPGCAAAAQPALPDVHWATDCKWAYRVELGDSGFYVLRARGLVESVKGIEYRYRSGADAAPVRVEATSPKK